MKTNAPFLSVIVPVYNVEKYVSECVASLTEQTFHDFEIILVNDGSTDNCPALCEQLAREHENVRVIHRENGGLSAARDTGIDHARGEWLTFADSDDAVAPEMLERLVSLVKEHNVKIASVTADSMGQNGVHVYTSDEALLHLLREDSTFTTSAWGKLFHHSLFADIQFPEGLIYEDYYTVPRLIDKAGKIAHSDEALYHYRTDNSESITHAQFSPKRLAYFTVADEVDKFLSEKYSSLLKHAKNRRTRYAVSFFRQAAQCAERDKESERFLVRQVRRGIFPYLFSSYKMTSKAYGLLIALCPPLAIKLF